MLWLNSAWLLGIALFPFTSELINSGGFGDGAGLLYCETMAGLAAVQGLTSSLATAIAIFATPAYRCGHE